MKLNKQEIQFINALDAACRVSAKDCFVDKHTVTYLVKEEDIGQAIGKAGKNIKRMSKQLGRSVEILPFEKEPQTFLKKSLSIFKIEVKGIEEVKEKDRKVLYLKLDSENREKVLRNMGRFKRLKAILNKNFEIENVKLR